MLSDAALLSFVFLSLLKTFMQSFGVIASYSCFSIIVKIVTRVIVVWCEYGWAFQPLLVCFLLKISARVKRKLVWFISGTPARGLNVQHLLALCFSPAWRIRRIDMSETTSASWWLKVSTSTNSRGPFITFFFFLHFNCHTSSSVFDSDKFCYIHHNFSCYFIFEMFPITIAHVKFLTIPIWNSYWYLHI